MKFLVVHLCKNNANSLIHEFTKLVNEGDYLGAISNETLYSIINSHFYIEGERKSYLEAGQKQIAPNNPELKFGRAINPDFEYAPKAVKL